ncbi:MAG: hypothetical protein HXY51_08225 [Nitrospirae bacterium]|nr:hypothetical protein [Nitrospirota bacterium]
MLIYGWGASGEAFLADRDDGVFLTLRDGLTRSGKRPGEELTPAMAVKSDHTNSLFPDWSLNG